MSAIVEIVHGIPGLTPATLYLRELGSSDVANGAGDALAEVDGEPGTYRAAVDEPLTGTHKARMVDGSGNVLYTGVVDMEDDDAVHTVGELADLPIRTRSKQTDVETLLARLSEVRAAKLDEVSTLTQADVRSALLTMGVASVTAAISGNTIELYRGDSYTIPFQNLGDLTSRTNLWFTAKAKASDTDAAALVQIAETGDLLVLNGSATLPTGATASIVVDDEAAGTGRILVSAAAMAVLAPVSDGRWDLQWRAASGDVATPGRGTFKVLADITRRVA